MRAIYLIAGTKRILICWNKWWLEKINILFLIIFFYYYVFFCILYQCNLSFNHSENIGIWIIVISEYYSNVMENSSDYAMALGKMWERLFHPPVMPAVVMILWLYPCAGAGMVYQAIFHFWLIFISSFGVLTIIIWGMNLCGLCSIWKPL